MMSDKWCRIIEIDNTQVLITILYNPNEESEDVVVSFPHEICQAATTLGFDKRDDALKLFNSDEGITGVYKDLKSKLDNFKE